MLGTPAGSALGGPPACPGPPQSTHSGALGEENKALELGSDQIRVVSVAPGAIATLILLSLWIFSSVRAFWRPWLALAWMAGLSAIGVLISTAAKTADAANTKSTANLFIKSGE